MSGGADAFLVAELDEGVEGGGGAFEDFRHDGLAGDVVDLAINEI